MNRKNRVPRLTFAVAAAALVGTSLVATAGVE